MRAFCSNKGLMMKLPAPTLDHVCTLNIDLAPPLELGIGRAGNRRIIPIVGGTVVGPKLQGAIHNLGADWQTVFSNGLAELDTRYLMETRDGAQIEITNYGYRHGPANVIEALAKGKDVSPTEYYMRTHARLETGDKRYAWVNTTLFLGVGARFENSVVVDLYAIH